MTRIETGKECMKSGGESLANFTSFNGTDSMAKFTRLKAEHTKSSSCIFRALVFVVIIYSKSIYTPFLTSGSIYTLSYSYN